MKFRYIIRTKKGESQKGIIEASDKSTALKTLQDQGSIVIKLEPNGKGLIFFKEIKIFQRIKRKDVFVFFRQLSILVGADVPLVQSLKILSDQFESQAFKEVISKMVNRVDSGSSFSQALSEDSKTFSSFAINLIKTGEVSGRLRESLDYLADHLEREYYLISKVRGAMAYPAFILFVFVSVAVLVIVMVIPSLTSVLIESGQELPISTRLVIWTSNLLLNFGWLIILLVVAAGVFIWKQKDTLKGKRMIDTFKIKIPIFGKILQKTYLARLADNLGVLIKGGVSIVESLDISGRVVGNVVFQKIIFQARDDVRIGKTISSTFDRYEEIPPLFNQMVRTGEKTGKLEIILEKLSSFYSKEVENVVDNITQIIEPVLLILLGAGISVLVFAVFMPIYNLTGSF